MKKDISSSDDFGFSNDFGEVYYTSGEVDSDDGKLQDFAGSFGSTLGNALVPGNPFGGVAAGSILNLTARYTVQISKNAATGQDLTNKMNVQADLRGVLAGSLSSALSGYFAGELVNALGVKGDAARLLNSSAATLFNLPLGRLADGLFQINGATLQSAWGTAFSFGEGGALSQLTSINGVATLGLTVLGSFLGQKLGAAIIGPETKGASIVASIGTSVGAAGGGIALGALAGAQAGSVVPIIGTFIGAAVGTVLGTALGNVIFPYENPEAWSYIRYGASPEGFGAWYVEAKAGGSTVLADAMGQHAAEILNTATTFVGGRVVSPDGAPSQYGHIGSVFKVSFVRQPGFHLGRFDTNAASPDDAVRLGVTHVLQHMELDGADPIMTRALYHGATIGMEQVLANLTVAADYRKYLSNTTVINALIEAAPESAFAAGWGATLAAAAALRLNDSTTIDHVRVARTDGSTVWAGDNGNYRLLSTALNVTLIGGTGHDELFGGASNDLLRGGGADDVLDGGGGDDLLFGDAGDDVLISSGSQEHLDGGAGNDVATFERITGLQGSGLHVNLAEGAAHFEVTVPTTTSDNQVVYGRQGQRNTLAGIEGAIGTSGADRLTGDGADNTFLGGAGEDALLGAGGNDVLVGGSGADALDGGDGDDTAAYAGSLGGVLVDLQSGTGQFNDAQGDQLVNVENVFGTGWDDTLVGDWRRNRLTGALGQDTLRGNEGDDVLEGGAGNDTLMGGADNDAVYGNEGADFLAGEGGSDTLVAGDGNDSLWGGVGNDVLYAEAGDDFLAGEDGADALEGQEGNDTLYGGVGDDRLDGGAGDDALYGEGGNDALAGGAGRDVLDGGDGWDVASYDAGQLRAVQYGSGRIAAASGKDGADRLTNVEVIQAGGSWIARDQLATLDALGYVAAYADLASYKTFGSQAAIMDAGAEHYVAFGVQEARGAIFDGLRYLASNADLIGSLNPKGDGAAIRDAGALHYILYGRQEGRSTQAFNTLSYVAANADLIQSAHNNNATNLASVQQNGALHYINNGYGEGRTTSFDVWSYLASNPDLIVAFKNGEWGLGQIDAGAYHYIVSGYIEKRATDNFSGLNYTASYDDLTATARWMQNADLIERWGTAHYVQNGFWENRTVGSFNVQQYLANYGDLRAVFGNDLQAAALHYIVRGSLDSEQRTDAPLGELQAQVTTLYFGVLGRAPDAAGLAMWVDLLAQGRSLAEVRRYFAYSDEARNNLTAVYNAVFKHPPNAADLATCQDLFDKGVTLAQVRTAISTSPEAAGLLTTLYRDVLGRLPDAVGLKAWQNQLAGSKSLDDIRGIFANLEEAQVKLTGLYNDVLGRKPDPEGLALWKSQLAQSSSLTDVRNIFAASDEAQYRIEMLSLDVLGRGADTGLAGWQAELAQGVSLSQLRTRFATSEEAQYRIQTLSREVLGRGAGADLATWQNDLVRGFSLTQLSTAFANFGRGPTAADDPTLPFITPPPVIGSATIGAGPDRLVLKVSQDAYKGDAQYRVTVDGVQVGGILTAQTAHGSGQSDTVTVLGDFAAGNHAVAIVLLNDEYDGPGLDRNLYLDGATYNGATLAITAGNVAKSEPATFGFLDRATPPVVGSATIGVGPDKLVLKVSQDAYKGDAQYTVSVDGKQIGGVVTAQAAHDGGMSDVVTVLGDFAGGNHAVAVAFLNDEYDGPGLDRNLYLDGATYNGATLAITAGNVAKSEPATFGFLDRATPPVVGSATIGVGPDKLVLKVSQDAYKGDAQYTVSVDGRQIGGVVTAQAAHDGGTSDIVTVLGDFAVGNHAVAVAFLNDEYDGPGLDRNLYLDSATYNGATLQVTAGNVARSEPATFGFLDQAAPPAVGSATIGFGSDKLVLKVSQDAYKGDAQYTVSVDGVQVGGVVTAQTAHSGGQSDTVTILGDFAAGNHAVAVAFLNDEYDGPGLDRNLYLDSATYNGATLQVTAGNVARSEPATFGFLDQAAPPAVGSATIGFGSDKLVLKVSQDAYKGDAQYTVSVDGVQVGGIVTAQAAYGSGQSDTLTVLGDFAAGKHTASVMFLNDEYDGFGLDRNLFLDSATYNGATLQVTAGNVAKSDPAIFSFTEAFG